MTLSRPLECIAGTDSDTQTNVGNQLISAFKQIAADTKKLGLPVFAATITPFGGNGQSYSDPNREKMRNIVNDWILTSGTFDAVIDFSKILGDPSAPSQLASRYDGRDHLHPNVAGYQHLAEQFPLSIFKATPASTSVVPTSTAALPSNINDPLPTTTSTPTLIVDPPPLTTTSTTTAHGSLQTHYGQCGGRGWTGKTVCELPYICTVVREYYSCCF